MKSTISREDQAIRREKAIKARQTRERAVKKSWERIKKEKAIKELMRFMDIEIKRYRDVGSAGTGIDKDGILVHFSNEQRISYMDRASGIEEIYGYMERMSQK